MSTAGAAPVGKIESLRFARLLARLWEQGFTGSFRAQSNVRPGVRITKEILFERGRIAWAASDDPEESIRAHLVNRGLLRSDQWRLAEEKAGSAQARQTLAELGFLTSREIQEADRERVAGIVLSLFSWRDGDYESAAGSLAYGTPNLKVDPRDLVLEGLMSSGDRGLVLDEIGSIDAVFVVRPDDLVRAGLSLPVELVGLMGKADGTRSIADICALSPLPDFLISAAFAGLKVLGLARPVEGVAAAVPPAPPIPAPERPPTRRRAGATTRDREVPRLPYEDVETVPVAATPPGGVRSAATAPARAQDSRLEDQGPGPVPTAPERRLVPEPEAAAAEADDEPVIRIEPAESREEAARRIAGDHLRGRPGQEPPAELAAEPIAAPGPGPAPPARPEPAADPGPDEPIDLSGAADEDDEDGGRETEIELTPGIPFSPLTPSLAREGTADISEEEIDDVIQILEPEDLPGASPAGSSASELFATEARADAALDEAGEPAAATAPEAEEQTGPHEDEEEDLRDGVGGRLEEEPPGEPWVYEPSGSHEEGRRTRRLTTWAALAASVLAVGALALFMFGSGDSAPAGQGIGEIATYEEPPADVQPPAAFGASSGPAGAGEAPPPASVERPAAASFTAATPSPAPVRPPAGQAEPRPAPRGSPPAAVKKTPTGRTVARGGTSAILSSDAYAQGRRLLAGGDYPAAAARFSEAAAAGGGTFTVQLALACEARTIARATESARGSNQLFILPTTFQGQACYRILWGAYPDRQAARNARSGVPKVFLEDRHPPVVAPL